MVGVGVGCKSRCTRLGRRLRQVGLNYTQPRPKSASEKEDLVSAGSRSSTAEPAAGDRSPTAASPEGGPEGTFQRGAGRLESLTRGWPGLTGLRHVRHVPGRCTQPLRSKSRGEAGSAPAGSLARNPFAVPAAAEQLRSPRCSSVLHNLQEATRSRQLHPLSCTHSKCVS